MTLPVHFDLSHVIDHGMTTYPGLPTPIAADHLTREAAEQIYGPGLTFQIGLVTMCTNTGTYLDVPFHRYANGHDLAKLDLARVASVDAIPITGAQTPTSRITQRWHIHGASVRKRCPEAPDQQRATMNEDEHQA